MLADFQNVGACRKSGALTVWLKSSCSDPCRCDVPLMQLLFAHSLLYCTGWLYRPDKPKYARKPKMYAEIKIIGGRIYFENFRRSLGAYSSAPRSSIKKP